MTQLARENRKKIDPLGCARTEASGLCINNAAAYRLFYIARRARAAESRRVLTYIATSAPRRRRSEVRGYFRRDLEARCPACPAQKGRLNVIIRAGDNSPCPAINPSDETEYPPGDVAPRDPPIERFPRPRRRDVAKLARLDRETSRRETVYSHVGNVRASEKKKTQFTSIPFTIRSAPSTSSRYPRFSTRRTFVYPPFFLRFASV